MKHVNAAQGGGSIAAQLLAMEKNNALASSQAASLLEVKPVCAACAATLRPVSAPKEKRVLLHASSSSKLQSKLRPQSTTTERD